MRDGEIAAQPFIVKNFGWQEVPDMMEERKNALLSAMHFGGSQGFLSQPHQRARNDV
ncbi:hypothetical protein [Paracoccus sp. S1E-3]|uniref:hypothetical protein n=1 Tax=Paracoccus sp. S1E-3 TaxID=2756130 RepID=UPI0015EF50D4|nr:hypothetical protein [Paracoccus sp. S1E-3]MBA4490911.1 hypothetical protein [Paracoccus sp. S1E-3]